MSNSEFWRLDHLSDQRLLDSLGQVLRQQRRELAELIAHLAEVEERRLHLGHRVHGGDRRGASVGGFSAARARVVSGADVRHGRMEPKQLRFAVPVTQTSLEALRAHGEIQQVRRSLELYRAQREFVPPEDFAERVRRLLQASPLISS